MIHAFEGVLRNDAMPLYDYTGAVRSGPEAVSIGSSTHKGGLDHTLPHRIILMSTQVNTENQAKANGKNGPFNFLAFVLGLVLPGLGHFSIGERSRGYRILAGFLVLWIGGLLIGGLGSVRSFEPEYATGGNGPKRNLWFYAQMGAGPIALVFDQLDKRLIREAPDETKIAASLPNQRVTMVPGETAIGHAAEFGMLYCALAGLMNVAIAIDAGRRSAPSRRAAEPVRIRRSTSPAGQPGGAA